MLHMQGGTEYESLDYCALLECALTITRKLLWSIFVLGSVSKPEVLWNCCLKLRAAEFDFSRNK